MRGVNKSRAYGGRIIFCFLRWRLAFMVVSKVLASWRPLTCTISWRFLEFGIVVHPPVLWKLFYVFQLLCISCVIVVCKQIMFISADLFSFFFSLTCTVHCCCCCSSWELIGCVRSSAYHEMLPQSNRVFWVVLIFPFNLQCFHVCLLSVRVT